MTTPFGEPSDVLVTGNIGGVSCVLLARHGKKHTIHPSAINYRANVWALAIEGCTHIIATTACGSLQEHIHPGHIVIPDQFIDRTFKREPTFYDGGADSPKGVCHLPMHQPYCEKMRQVLVGVAKGLGLVCHEKGTVLTIEGPRFSTRAESKMFRGWGCDVINMTTVPEVCLAKEMGICYGSIALPTDYDSWRESEGGVTVEEVFKTLSENAEKATHIIHAAVPVIAKENWTKTYEEMKQMLKVSVIM